MNLNTRVENFLLLSEAYLDDIRLLKLKADVEELCNLIKEAEYLVSEIKIQYRDYRIVELLEVEKNLYTYRLLSKSKEPSDTIFILDVLFTLSKEDDSSYILLGELDVEI